MGPKECTNNMDQAGRGGKTEIWIMDGQRRWLVSLDRYWISPVKEARPGRGKEVPSCL